MHFTGTTNRTLLLACAAATVAACSGSASSGLLTPSPTASAITTPSDASAGVPFATPDGAADTQADSPAPPATLSGHGDDLSTDGGFGRDAGSSVDDASLGAASADAARAADDAVAPTTCPVAFTVTNAIVDGLYFTGVVLSGDVPALGAWDPAKVVTMTSSMGVGVWTTTTTLVQGTIVNFKFGMASSTGAVTFESAPANTDRELLIDCTDAAAISYVGQYNVVPDAGP
jgi:hypothetical protein